MLNSEEFEKQTNKFFKTPNFIRMSIWRRISDSLLCMTMPGEKKKKRPYLVTVLNSDLDGCFETSNKWSFIFPSLME